MNQQRESMLSYKEEAKKVNASIDALPHTVGSPIKKEAEALKAKYNSDMLQLKVGDTAPDFTLKNALGKNVNLYELLEDKRVVLTFYRGTWCPYCNLQLSQYQEVFFKLRSIGSVMVAVSPQNPDESLNMQEKNDLSFEVLSDPKNLIAEKFTTVIKKSDDFVETISGFGKAFQDHYTDDSNEVPIPAVFIIEQDKTISFAKSEGGDYRNRVEADDVLKALSSKS